MLLLRILRVLGAYLVGSCVGFFIMFDFTARKEMVPTEHTTISARNCTAQSCTFDVSHGDPSPKKEGGGGPGETRDGLVRISCLVSTSGSSHKTSALTVKETWGRRCSRLTFMSTEKDASLPAVAVRNNDGESAEDIVKIMQGFIRQYDDHRDEANWFLNTDDDTFVIMENLISFLSDKNTSDPVFFGMATEVFQKEEAFPGNSGIVVSLETLRRLHGVMNSKSVCSETEELPDYYLAKCLHHLHVKALNSSDSSGRSRFHQFNIHTNIQDSFRDWMLAVDEPLFEEMRMATISNTSISFHEVTSKEMRVMEFFLYHIRLSGVDEGSSTK